MQPSQIVLLKIVVDKLSHQSGILHNEKHLHVYRTRGIVNAENYGGSAPWLG
jgi:hypothetical protein